MHIFYDKNTNFFKIIAFFSVYLPLIVYRAYAEFFVATYTLLFIMQMNKAPKSFLGFRGYE